MEQDIGLKPHVIRRRLLKLAAFLDKLPRSKFDYCTWGECDADKATEVTSLAQYRCGTSGCALGWAASMPEFRRLGLGLAFHNNGIVDEGKVQLTVMFDGSPSHWGYEVFGREASEHCFFPNDDKGEERATARYVAKKIRKYVADKLPTRDELRAKKGLKPARKAVVK